MSLPHSLPMRVVQVHDTHVVLEDEAQQSLRFPRTHVAGEPAIGDIIHLVAFTDEQSLDERRTVAKQVLNELLGSA